PLLAFPRVQGVLDVHVGAEAAAVDLAGPELHQLLRRGRQGRIMHNGPRRVDVLDELQRQGAAEVIETGFHRHLLAVLAGQPELVVRWLVCSSQQYDDATPRNVRRRASLTIRCAVSSDW